MKITSVFLWCAVGFLISIMVLINGCGKSPEPPKPESTKPEPIKSSQLKAEEFLAQQKGKVVVALLGIEGCPGTRKATEILAKMSQDCPADLVMARLDVPLQVESQFKPLTNWSYNYYHAIDSDRAVANRLEFFFYPTLYIIDRDGEVRYSGGCDEEKLKSMITEILQEKPGIQKKIYTPPMLAVGASAPLFQAKTIKNEGADLQQLLAKGPALLFFTSAGCPFSREDAKKIPNLEKEFKDKVFTIVIIEKGRNTEVINNIYQSMDFSGVVILDSDNSISQKYSVEPVPFYFTIDKDGKVTARGPYTDSAARQALNALFGIQSNPQENPAGGAG
ncbi:MAG: TlpA family protein disulfide reductase [Planctomycetota bacterium]